MTLKKIYKPLVAVVMASIVLWACTKPDTAVKDDARLDRPYCNDPEAINYNWDFPGVPDNTKCFYPIEIFSGNYSFTDSIFDADFKPDTILKYNIRLFSLFGSKIKIGITGFCSTDTLRLTADRFYKAFLDSAKIVNNGVDYTLNGQYMCRIKDTVSGNIVKSQTDAAKLSIFFTVASDTGYSYHKGTAIKQ